MSFIHDVIKIQYVQAGYLPDYPYHLIADEEMCDAFVRLPESVQEYITPDYFGQTLDETKTTIDWFHAYETSSDAMFFRDNYPMIDLALEYPYKDLLNRIFYEIQEFKNNLDDDKMLPDWVYSYMLGVVIGPESSILDIHDFIYSMGTDNTYDEYNLDCAIACLRISKEWLKKIIVPEGEAQRPPTMFGEPHVLKAIRLDQESLLVTDLPSN